MSDVDFLEAQVRGLENENRALRQTLRDQFAMAALAGLIGDTPKMMRDIADAAYQQADEMLKAREWSVDP